MSQPDPTPAKALQGWVAPVVVGLVLVAILAIAAVLLFAHETGPHGARPIVTETEDKDPETGLILVRRTERFKDPGQLQMITLSIAGGRSVEEPFAFYQYETHAQFHWDHGKLDACVEGYGYTDKGAYWLDHIVLPDGGVVQIVKTCDGFRLMTSATTPPT
jgi:hypothetical protein